MKFCQKLFSLMLTLMLLAGSLSGPGIAVAQAEGSAPAEPRSEPVSGDGGWLYRMQEDGSAEVLGHSSTEAVTLRIPDKLGGGWVTRIGEEAFSDNPALTKVFIPGAVTQIADTAFAVQERLTIQSYAGSAALAFASANGHTADNLSRFYFAEGVLDLTGIAAADYHYSGGSVTITGPHAARISAGTLFYLPADGAYSLGAPWIASAVTPVNGGVRVTIADAPITQALTRIVERDVQLTPDVANVELAKGVELVSMQGQERDKLSLTMGTLTFKGTVELSDKQDLSYTLLFTPDITLTADVKLLNLDESTFSYTNKSKVSFSAGVSNTNKYTEDFEGDKQKTIKLGRVPFVSGGLIRLYADMAIKVNVSGEISIDVSYTFSETFTWDAGKLTKTRTEETPPDVDINLAVSASVKVEWSWVVNIGFPKTSFKMDIAKLALSFGPTFKATVEPTMCIDVSTSLELSLDFSFGILSGEKGAFSVKLTIFKSKWSPSFLQLHYEPNTCKFVDSCTMQHDVTFLDGTSDTPYVMKDIQHMSTIPAPDEPTREGYTFAGWYSDVSCTQVFDFATPITKDITLYAGWQDTEGNVSVGQIPVEDTDFPEQGGTTGNGYTLLYELNADNQSYYLSGYTGTPVDVAIPETYNGLPVTSIGGFVFSPCSSLTSIIIPDSVTSIGKMSFANCKNLTSIVIPDSVTSIGESAFSGCASLTSIVIPNSITSIGDGVFGRCTNLISIDIPDSVTSIDRYAFQRCESLISINIPDSVTYIGKCAFQSCYSLTSIYIPESVTSLEERTFDGCHSLTSIIIPDSVTSLGEGAFASCTSLTRIIIPDSVTSLGISLFQDCTSLTDVIIPDSVNGLPNFIFSGCTSLASITIPNSVRYLENEVFYGCTSLTSITIPDSVTGFGDRNFYGCTSLTSIIIPDSVTSLGTQTFYGCKSLISINIPESIDYLAPRTFYNCDSLTNITFPKTMRTVSDYAFANCDRLKTITVPGTEIGLVNNAFESTYLSVIYTVPGSGVEKWAKKNQPYAKIIYSDFANTSNVIFNSCGGTNTPMWSAFSGTLIPTPTPPTRADYRFTGWYQDAACTLPWDFATGTLPEGGLTLYAGWAPAASAYLYETSGTGVVITDYLGGAVNLTLPESLDGLTVLGLGEGAIPSHVQQLTIPASYAQVDAGAFKWASGLRTITVSGAGKLSAQDGVLFGADGMICYPQMRSGTGYALPEGTSAIGAEAFRDAANLTSVTVPASVKRIGEKAFRGCTGLQAVTLAAEDVALAGNAFSVNPDSMGTSEDDTEVYLPINDGFVLYGPVGSQTLLAYATARGIEYNTYLVRYKLGDEIVGADRITAGELISDVRRPENAEQVFVGWSQSADGNPLWNFAANAMPAHDLTLYAVWKVDFAYTLAADHAALTRYLGSSKTVRVPESIEGLPVTEIAADCFPSPSGLTLIANRGSAAEAYALKNGIAFQPLTYTLHFETNGGTFLAEQQLAATDAIVQPDCQRDGCTLAGWYTDAAFTTAWDFAADVMPAHSLTLFAKWKTSSGGSAPKADFSVQRTEGGVVITGYSGSASELTLPESINGEPVVAISSEAFRGNAVLKKVTVPGCVKTIGARAFAESAVTEITLLDGVTTLGEGCFADCTALSKITFPDSIAALPDSCLAGCIRLTKVKLPGQLKTMGANAFLNCKHLPSLSFPATLETVGANALNNCSAMTAVSFGPKVTGLNASTFLNCSALQSITVDEANPAFASRNGMLTDKAGTTLIYLPEGYMGDSFTVPDGFTAVAPGALRNTSISTLTLPASVTTLGDGFAQGAMNLTKVSFASGTKVSAIPRNAFRGCMGLTEITLPGSITRIEGSAFAYCPSLASVTIPDSVTAIAENAFPASDALVLYGSAHSAASQYAKQQGISFVPEGQIRATGVTLPETLALTVGDTETLMAVLQPANAMETPLTWYVDDRRVAIVENGAVTARSAGTTLVYAILPDGSGAKCTLTVAESAIQPESVLLSQSVLKLEAGYVQQLSASLLPATATERTLTWASSNPTVATVSNGLVTALADGVAVVTVTASNGLSASCQVLVGEGAASDIPGDANDDFRVTLADALLIFEYGSGAAVSLNQANADVDGSGSVTPDDGLRILQFLAGWNVTLQ